MEKNPHFLNVAKRLTFISQFLRTI